MSRVERVKLTLAVLVLGLVALYTPTAYAQVPWTAEYINMNIISGFGVATGTYEWPDEIVGNNYWVEYGVETLPDNNNFYALKNTQQCYPLAGGTSSFQNGEQVRTFTASTTQTTNNGFGAPDCDVSGYYHDIFRNTTASTTILYILTWYYNAETNLYSIGNIQNGTTTPTIPIPKNIEILQPTYGTTTATTTFGVSIKYRTPFSLDFRPTTTRYYEIVDAVTGEFEYQYYELLPANTGENLTITATNTVSVGSKYIRAMYLDTNGQPYSEIDEVFFNVATNTYFMATGLLTPRSSPTDLTQIDCLTFDIGCQFQKALTFLFKPSTDTLDKFANIWQTIKEKKPFGYVSVTIDQLKALDTSGAAAFSLGTIPFMDAIFTPFRTLFAGILWALFAIYFYQRRLIHLDI